MQNELERRNNYRRRDDIYRKSVEDVRDYAIFMTDGAGYVTNWNAGASFILGYSEEEAIGKSASQFFTPEDRAKGEPGKELQTALAHGRAEDERWHVRKNGSRFWASGVVTPAYDRNGLLVGFSKVMRDMTERKRLEEERDRFFELSMDMLSIIGLDGRFRRVNQAFEKILGHDRQELLSSTVFDLIHPDDRAQTESGYEDLRAGEPIVLMENRLRRNDGGYSWVAWSYFPVPSEGVAFAVGRDMTQFKRMNELIQTRAAELEQANRVKDEFLATLSHELRTPLTSILGWSRLLRGRQLSDQESDRAIQIIQRNAESQARIIEDLLDVSRIITGKLRIEFQPVSVPPIVEMVVNALRPAAEAKHLTLETSIDPIAARVLGDPTRLQQIVTNLLSNAIKFTPDGGKISVSLKRIDSHARLTVKDTGIGITAEALPHIFERFTQVDSSNIRAHSGLGLGLAIVDYLVRQQGGTVNAESGGLGEGATFRVDLPLTKSEVITDASNRVDLFSKQAAAFSSPPDTYAPTVLLNGVRVLLVEDENDTRELLKTLIEKSGAKVTPVQSVRAALEEIERTIPDVIVSDIGMPSENGYDLITRIRDLQPDPRGRIPAIALTAYAGAADRRRALLAGFQTHLAKPVEPDELIAVIATLVKF